ncbi:ATP-dependent Clp protease adapter chloroplastic [Chlorella sorokiniana]|uniref:ATP-dependent Clp protease adapter chloroplastic n=1 Tax=Chlorella sorokiniana TaxID=3076 RepID=A0A2P6TJ08_CHLSO|nr:ATP-dependent Clp protease adapter chloroplastic [Chlorella sorokiniana]|eukprot:PRW39223.1 ATP-dependent Clp protease adapter chloroplastic [Chlorella sorokiniana]
MLHNDNYNRREYVVQVLLKVVDGTTVDDAVNIMQEAHINGLAMVTQCSQAHINGLVDMVTQCSQDKAEEYCENLRLNGLISTIEPAGGGGSSGGPEAS